MKTEKHTLQTLADNLEYFESFVSVQSDPSCFNGISTEIELRIDIILKYIKKDGVNVSKDDLDFAFSLLRKYIAIWQLYFQNHPWRPLREN